MIFNVGAESGGSWNPALNELGAKNLLKNTLTNRTVDGVTFTVNNEDGSVTANGTASKTITGGTVLCSIYLEQGKEYIISGGISSTKRICIYYSTDYKVLNNFSHGSDFKFTVPISGTYNVYCWVEKGATCNNDTFKPMLRHASISDDTYEPYAMTNKELTDGLKTVKTYVDEDGKLHFVDSAGADTVLPFSSGLSNIGIYTYAVFSGTTGTYICTTLTKDNVHTVTSGTNTDGALKSISGVGSVGWGKFTVSANGFKYKYASETEWRTASVGESLGFGANGTIFTWE